MANTVGGKILLGVRDDGTVVGVRDSNTLRARIQDIARNCDPPVRIRLHPAGEVIAVHVKESDSKPVQCSEGLFSRQGAVTQKLTRAEIRDRFPSEGAVRFDLAPCPQFAYPQDFDLNKFNTWLRRSGIATEARIEDVLVNIDAAERVNGELLFRNGGVLFFAKNARQFFPQAYITCLLARGTDKVHILDRKHFDGGIVADIEEAMRFVERNTRTAYRIEGLQREDVPEYPVKAVREAITNAVMHRDWFVEGANVFVEIYANRMEVVSPGGLPGNLSIADLGGRSVRRNSLIADLLHRIAFIEKAGTGMLRIRHESRDLRCPDPEFEVNGFFTARFWPTPEVRETTGAPTAAPITGQVTDQVTDQVIDQVLLLSVMVGEMSREQLQEALGLKHRGHFRGAYLLPALRAGLIEMTAPDKPRSRNQRYRLTSAGRNLLTRIKQSDC